MNRNWVEEIDLPSGPDNNDHAGWPRSGPADAFPSAAESLRVPRAVPKDFAEKDEMIWTLTTHGVTRRRRRRSGQTIYSTTS